MPRPIRHFYWIFALLIAAVLLAGALGSVVGPTPLFVLIFALAIWTARGYYQLRPRITLRSLLILMALLPSAYLLWQNRKAWVVEHALDVRADAVAMSHDGHFVATTVVQGNTVQLTIWNVETGRAVATIPTSIVAIRDVCLGFTPDDRHVLCGGMPSTSSGPVAELWDWPNGKRVRAWPGVNAAAVAPTGDRFCVLDRVGGEPIVRVHRIDRDEPLFEVRDQSGIVDMAFSRTGKYLSLTPLQLPGQVWDVEAGTQIGTTEVSPTPYPPVRAPFAPDESCVAIRTPRGIEIRSLPDFKIESRFERPDYVQVHSFAWWPDTSKMYLAYTSNVNLPTGNVRLLLLDRSCKELATGAEQLGDAVVSPDGQRVARTFFQTEILSDKLQSLASFDFGRSARPSQTRSMYPVCFSPDGQRLVHNGQATIWKRTRDEHWYGLLTLPYAWLTGGLLALFVANIVLQRRREAEVARVTKEQELQPA